MEIGDAIGIGYTVKIKYIEIGTLCRNNRYEFNASMSRSSGTQCRIVDLVFNDSVQYVELDGFPGYYWDLSWLELVQPAPQKDINSIRDLFDKDLHEA